MCNSGGSHIDTLEIEQQELSRNSNGYNFSHEGPSQALNILRCSKFNNGSSRKIQMVITLLTGVRFRSIVYRDARNSTTKALVKFSRNSNGQNFSHGG